MQTLLHETIKRCTYETTYEILYNVTMTIPKRAKDGKYGRLKSAWVSSTLQCINDYKTKCPLTTELQESQTIRALSFESQSPSMRMLQNQGFQT